MTTWGSSSSSDSDIKKKSAVQSDWIDPDTPASAHTIQSLAVPSTHRQDPSLPEQYRLVFSDEFNVESRTFGDGDDPRWTAVNKNDVANNPLHYYSDSPETVHSQNGALKIGLDVHPKSDLYSPWTEFESKEFRSGMLQSWNKFCFTGGIVEMKAKLPGPATKGAGLWPALWMLGNLARATYLDSTEQIWPFSTNICDHRTSNSQLINSCNNVATVEGMPQGRGRGAPEIDLLEVMYMEETFEHPILSTSLQVAPGVPEELRPPIGRLPNSSDVWYSPFLGTNATQNAYYSGIWVNPANTSANSYRTDALTANLPLSNDFFQDYHSFRVEWEPPRYISDSEKGKSEPVGGYVQWFVDDKLVSAVYGDDVFATSQAEIPTEPMYLVMNLAVSKEWGFPNARIKNCTKICWSCLEPECACAMPTGFCDNIPTTLDIDYVRVYQPAYAYYGYDFDHKYSLGCSPPNRPTEQYIQANEDKYKMKDDDKPLKAVATGGGSCQNDADCGTTTTVNRGVCVLASNGDGTAAIPREFICHCSGSWTGPHCLAHYGPVPLQVNDSDWKDLYYNNPRDVSAPKYICGWPTVAAGVLVVSCLIVLVWKSKTACARKDSDDTEKPFAITTYQYQSIISPTESSECQTDQQQDMEEASYSSYQTIPRSNCQ